MRRLLPLLLLLALGLPWSQAPAAQTPNLPTVQVFFGPKAADDPRGLFFNLMRFLDSMQIPVVTTLRDSQQYVYAAEQGLGLHEMNPARVHPELQQWDALWAWLESRRPHAMPVAAAAIH